MTLAVNELHRFGMLPGKIGFLRTLSSVYGPELLKRTALRWIPVTEPPGNLFHRSRHEFIELLKAKKEVLLASGVPFGEAYELASGHIKQQELASLIVVSATPKEIDVDYSAANRLAREMDSDFLLGSLSEVLSRAACSDSRLLLTRFFLQCAAEAWGVPAEELAKNSTWHLRYRADVLWTVLRAP